jgi:hypothetical protein
MSTSDYFELLFLIGGSAIIFIAWLGMAIVLYAPRHFSLRTLLIGVTAVAVVLGAIVTLSR